jgi:hypothetical protein
MLPKVKLYMYMLFVSIVSKKSIHLNREVNIPFDLDRESMYQLVDK